MKTFGVRHCANCHAVFLTAFKNQKLCSGCSHGYF